MPERLEVVIGPEYDVNRLVKYLPSKSVFIESWLKILKTLKDKGRSFISQDRRGLDRWAPELYKEYRIDPEISSFLDHFYAGVKKIKK